MTGRGQCDSLLQKHHSYGFMAVIMRKPSINKETSVAQEELVVELINHVGDV